MVSARSDKVSINSAAVRDPEFVREAALKFGSQCIVVAIDAKRVPGQQAWEVYTHGGRNPTEWDAVDWAREVVSLGAGEILLTSIDREGTGAGFDDELVKVVSSLVGIPVIAHGGAGNSDHLVNVLQNGKADAIAIASMFHYSLINENSVKAHRDKEGNIEFLKQKRIFKTSCKKQKLYLQLFR